VSIAKEIELDKPFERIGAELVREVAKKTDDVAGDGTTTATVLAQALVHEGLRNVAAGANPMALKRGIEIAVASVCEALAIAAKDVETKEEIAATASISAGDTSVTEITAEAMDKVGREDVITVAEAAVRHDMFVTPCACARRGRQPGRSKPAAPPDERRRHDRAPGQRSMLSLTSLPAGSVASGWIDTTHDS
jgi:hypothetical protein